MSKLTREEAAQILGMKVREVIQLVPVRGGTVVVTHDQVETLVTDDGRIRPYVRLSLAESVEVDDDEGDDPGTEGGAEPGAEPAKRTPRRR